MKYNRIILSLVLVVCVLSTFTISVFARGTDSAKSVDEKYSDRVIEFLSNSKKDITSFDADSLTTNEETFEKEKRLPVYIWYKDIDQDIVNAKTKKIIGVTAEECNKIDFSSAITDIGLSYDKAVLEEYIVATNEMRDIEKANVEKYTMARRQIASKMYIEKSQKLINEISIDNQNINFRSELAPFVVANLTAEEIKKANELNYTEIIGYYEETECIEPTIDSASEITNIDDINSNTLISLTGEGVKVGLIENYRVSFYDELANTELYGEYGIVADKAIPLNYPVSNEIYMRDYGNVVVVGNSQRCPITQDEQGHDVVPHADRTSKTLRSVAPNIKLYTSNWEYDNIEAMVLDGVKILSMSLAWCVQENADDYTYTLRERWMDHLAANHGVTMLIAAGNDGKYDSDGYHTDTKTGELVFHFGARVTSPALAYNVISVGAYNEDLPKNDLLWYGSLQSYSSYKNFVVDANNIKHYGCEKPDVVVPSNFNGGGTSNATPFLAGIVALMFELKPTLSNYPQETKAIVLASCQRKVKQNSNQGAQETMYSGIQDRQDSGSQSGITERQGAGAPDAWNMACIICQGNYGSAVINGTTSSINIEQPPYGATDMNISISCIKENVPVNGHSEANITEGITNNLDLTVYHNNTAIRKSALWVSSTEMCYVPLSSSNFKYKFTINQNETPNLTRFGYAWSTNNMRIALAPTNLDKITEGIYYIKNKANERYVTYNLSAQSNSEKAKMGYTSAANQNNFSDVHTWIVKSLGNEYNIEIGYGVEENFLGYGSQISNNILASNVSTVADSIIIKKNTNGSYSIYNTLENKILSYDSSRNLIWIPYSSNQTINGSEQWYFEKANYIRGDANKDGSISTEDVAYVQQYLVGLISLNNIERYLSDSDRDGLITIGDATRIESLINNTHIY